MKDSYRNVIQYVGFRTALPDPAFLKAWTPIAMHFKSQGLKVIQLYKVLDHENFTFLSQNIWAEKTYLNMFPDGVPAFNGSSTIEVTQFGGYHLEMAALPVFEHMQILFQESAAELHEADLSCFSVTEKVPFRHIVIYKEFGRTYKKSGQLLLSCKHIKSL